MLESQTLRSGEPLSRTIFISYCRQDRKYVQGITSLVYFLRGLEIDHGISFWWDARIATGEVWDDSVREQIEISDLVIALVSQHFLNSAYIRRAEVATFLKRRKEAGIGVFPIIVSPCDWQEHDWLSQTKHLPGDGKTVEEHYYRDRGKRERLYLHIRREIVSRLAFQAQEQGEGLLRRKRSETHNSIGGGPASAKQAEGGAEVGSGTGSSMDSLAVVEKFLDAGDYLSAIHRLLSGRSYEESARETQLDVAVICQKMGRIERARRYLDWSLDPERGEVEARKFAQFALLNIKVFSQEGQHEKLLQNLEGTISLLTRTHQERRVPQLFHRAGTAAAVLGRLEEAEQYFAKGCGYAVGFGNRHAEITINVFWALATALRGVGFGSREAAPIATLKRSQLEYLGEGTDSNLWQANRFKSVVQALFAEATVILAREIDDPLGRVLLTAAHLLAPRARAHPNSEGYAELLWLIEDRSLREMVGAACRTDEEGRTLYQRDFLASTRLLDSCRDCLALPSPETSSDWRQLRSSLSSLSEV